MGLSGTIDPTVYEGLKDVLQRYPTVTTVTYEPNSIVKQSLQANVDPNRVVPPTGPETPVLDVEWRFRDDTSQYRIHYADPNIGFDCGWHCDDDHPGPSISSMCSLALPNPNMNAPSYLRRRRPRSSGSCSNDCSKRNSPNC